MAIYVDGVRVKTCPIRGGVCSREYCEWYVQDLKKCAIVVIALGFSEVKS